MQITARILAEMVSGEIDGNPDVSVTAPAKIEEAKEGEITFLANPKYEEYVYTTEASVILVNRTFQPREAIKATLLRVDDVYATLGLLLGEFGDKLEGKIGISDKAEISEKARIDGSVSVGAFTIVSDDAVIGKDTVIFGQVYVGKGVTIGRGVRIYPGVKIYRECVIGDYCVIHSNTVIGSDGFGFNKKQDGSYDKIPQIGNVVVEDNVEIGANVVIDRATMGSTIIRTGTKLDNLIQIAHNVEVGANNVIAAQTGIAGSTKLDEGSMIGGQVGIAGHLSLAKNLMIQAGSKIGKNVTEDGTKLYGYPAIDYVQYLRAYNVYKRLPELLKRLETLEKNSERNEPNA